MSDRRMSARLVAGVLAALLCTGALLALAAPAAAARPRLHGAITSAVQHRKGTVTVRGWAYDGQAPGASLLVCLRTRHRCVRTFRADRPSRRLDRDRGLPGRHRFRVVLPRQQPGPYLALRTAGPRYSRSRFLVARRVVSPGRRVVRIARRHLDARYSYGGASPRTGFDCSGYAMYAYRRAGVARLPHNAEAQRHARHMHRISRSHARPGDLIFYLSGGAAYHVAIYVGHGIQYSAATPRQGVRRQHIWSRNVEFRTDWH
jgi:hypothetical protein